MTTPPRAAIGVLSALFPGAALACASGPGTLDIPLFVIAFVVVALIVATLTFALWAGQSLFGKAGGTGRPRTPAWLAATVLTALALGAIGTFALPAFETVFHNFETELRAPTRILLSARYALWLPALLLALALRTAARRVALARFLAPILLGETVLLAVVLWALYLPIFILGCVTA